MKTEHLLIIDNREERRFETELEGQRAFVQYSDDGEVVTMTHTEVPEVFKGQGVGSRLVKGALETVQTAGKKVDPQCPFVAAFIEKHSEYKTLVV